MKLRRIVVVNDDGIDAPGLAVAEKLAATLADEVWVFAPAGNQSGKAQALTLRQAIDIQEHGKRRYAITGTPADCVMVALGTDWMGGQPPDLVLSGVNWGQNVSDSVAYSGTVGAALTAAHFGLPAVALSQNFSDPQAFDFSVSEYWGQGVVEALWAHRDEYGCLWNLNFPPCAPSQVAGLRFTREVAQCGVVPRVVGQADPEGNTRYWIGFGRNDCALEVLDTDIAALQDNYVSATPLKVRRSDEQRLAEVGPGREWPLVAPSVAAF